MKRNTSPLRQAALVAALALGATGAHAENIVVRFSCEMADGSTHLMDQDVSARFAALAVHCAAVEWVAPTEPVAVMVDDALPLPVRVIIAAPQLLAHADPTATPAALWPLIEAAARRYGMDPQLVQAVMQVESAYAVRARSPKGALGLMQLMPATGARFGATSAEQLLDPAFNIDVGVRYLRQLSEQFGHRSDLVLAAYNAGEGAVLRHHQQVPPYPETRDYVRKVLALLPSR